MSNEYLGKARRMRVGNSTRKLILIILADNANDDGWCWPSHKRIASDCEVTDRSVRTHIKALEEMGVIEIHPRIDPMTGNMIGTKYRLTIGDEETSPLRKEIPHPPERDSAPLRKEIPPNHHIEPSENHHIPPTSLPPQGGDGRALAKQVVVKRQGTFFENSEYRGVVPDEWIAWAVSRGMPRSRAFMAAEAFQDYWIAATGVRARKRDWFATWRNWIRRDAQSGARRSGDDFSPRAFMDLAREAYEEAEQAAREEGGNGK